MLGFMWRDQLWTVEFIQGRRLFKKDTSTVVNHAGQILNTLFEMHGEIPVQCFVMYSLVPGIWGVPNVSDQWGLMRENVDNAPPVKKEVPGLIYAVCKRAV